MASIGLVLCYSELCFADPPCVRFGVAIAAERDNVIVAVGVGPAAHPLGLDVVKIHGG